MIQVDGLTKDYGARRAINNISFDANQGEIVGFLGPNGAGKTTTMRILTGYMPPTDGTAIVAGYDVVEESIEVRKRVGYLPETVPLYTDMTAVDYLKFMADLRHIPDSEERAYETLEMVGLQDRATGYIGNYSKGMRQKILLIAALLHNPDVLLLDEPFSGLDVATGLALRSLLEELARRGKVILFSSHELETVERVCYRVVILHKGRVVADDSISRLRELMALPTLEAIFSQLAVEQDTAVLSREIADAIAG